MNEKQLETQVTSLLAKCEEDQIVQLVEMALDKCDTHQVQSIIELAEENLNIKKTAEEEGAKNLIAGILKEKDISEETLLKMFPALAAHIQPKVKATMRPKYRNPANPNETYSGRGKPPGWWKGALARAQQQDNLSEEDAKRSMLIPETHAEATPGDMAQ